MHGGAHRSVCVLADVHTRLDALFDTMDTRKVGYLVIRVLLNNFAQMLCRTVQEQTEFYFALYVAMCSASSLVACCPRWF